MIVARLDVHEKWWPLISLVSSRVEHERKHPTPRGLFSAERHSPYPDHHPHSQRDFRHSEHT